MTSKPIDGERRHPVTTAAIASMAGDFGLLRAGWPYVAAGALALGASLSMAEDLATVSAQAIVDVQFSLCSPPALIEQGLSLRARGNPFDVWLFDDPALGLFEKGLRIRLRGAGQHFELTLKAANQDCSTLPLVIKSEGKCEYDLHGVKVVGALSLTRRIDAQDAQDLAAGRRPLADLLSAAQKRLLQQTPGAWPLPPGVHALGPTRVRSYRAPAHDYAVDVSELPGGQRFIEISSKVPQGDAAKVRDRMQRDLTEAGVAVCADQSAQAANKLRMLQNR